MIYCYYRTTAGPKIVELWTKQRNIMSQKTKDATTHAHNHRRTENIMSADIMAVATVLIPNALTIHFLYTVAYSCFHLDTTYRFRHTTLGSRVTFSLLNTASSRNIIMIYEQVLSIIYLD